MVASESFMALLRLVYGMCTGYNIIIGHPHSNCSIILDCYGNGSIQEFESAAVHVHPVSLKRLVVFCKK